jgi:hypothetical protein
MTHPTLTLPPEFGTSGSGMIWLPANSYALVVYGQQSADRGNQLAPKRSAAAAPETMTVSPGVLTLSALHKVNTPEGRM